MPLLFGAGEPGREILHPVAVTIFGGLVSSTLLDTLLTPVLFLRFGREAARAHPGGAIAAARGRPAPVERGGLLKSRLTRNAKENAHATQTDPCSRHPPLPARRGAPALAQKTGPNGGMLAGKGGHQTELWSSRPSYRLLLEDGKPHETKGVKHARRGPAGGQDHRPSTSSTRTARSWSPSWRRRSARAPSSC